MQHCQHSNRFKLDVLMLLKCSADTLWKLEWKEIGKPSNDRVANASLLGQ